MNTFAELETLKKIHHSFTMIIDYAHKCNVEGKKISKAGYWTYCTQNGVDLLPDQLN